MTRDCRDRGPSVGLEPVPGLYKTRLVRNGPVVPARIWWGNAVDDEGQPVDRAMRLRCLVAGEERVPLDVWPMHPISREEYDRLVAAMPDEPARPVAIRSARTF